MTKNKIIKTTSKHFFPPKLLGWAISEYGKIFKETQKRVEEFLTKDG
jgi:hypothetical protein